MPFVLKIPNMKKPFTIAKVTFKNGTQLDIELNPTTSMVSITSSKDSEFIVKGHPNWLFVTSCIESPPLWCPMELVGPSPQSVLLFINNTVVWIHESLKHHIYQMFDNPKIKLSSQNFFFYHRQKDHSALLNCCDRISGEVKTLFFNRNGVFPISSKMSPHTFAAGERLDFDQINGNLRIYNTGYPNQIEEFNLQSLSAHNQEEGFSLHSQKMYTSGDIFSFLKLSDFLKFYYEMVKSTRPQWSYQVWAQQLGLKSNTSLTKVINGQRKVGTDLKLALLNFFDFNDSEASYFNLLVNYDRAIYDDLQMAQFLKPEIEKRFLGKFFWTNCEFSQRTGLTRRHNESSGTVDLFLACGDKSRFSYICSGKPVELTDGLQNSEIGIDRVDDKIFFYSKQGYLIPVDLSKSIINPTNEGKWLSKKWITDNKAALFLFNSQTMEKVLYYYSDKYVFTIYPKVDLSEYHYLNCSSNELMFYPHSQTEIAAIKFPIPTQATNTMYYHDGIKFHFDKLSKEITATPSKGEFKNEIHA
jgi:hypothetical protein